MTLLKSRFISPLQSRRSGLPERLYLLQHLIDMSAAPVQLYSDYSPAFAYDWLLRIRVVDGTMCSTPLSSSPSAGPGLLDESVPGAPSSCFCSRGSALRDAAAEGGLSGGSVGCGAVDAGGRGMPIGAAWGREGVAKSQLPGGSGVTNPLPSTI